MDYVLFFEKDVDIHVSFKFFNLIDPDEKMEKIAINAGNGIINCRKRYLKAKEAAEKHDKDLVLVTNSLYFLNNTDV